MKAYVGQIRRGLAYRGMHTSTASWREKVDTNKLLTRYTSTRTCLALNEALKDSHVHEHLEGMNASMEASIGGFHVSWNEEHGGMVSIVTDIEFPLACII